MGEYDKFKFDGVPLTFEEPYTPSPVVPGSGAAAVPVATSPNPTATDDDVFDSNAAPTLRQLQQEAKEDKAEIAKLRREAKIAQADGGENSFTVHQAVKQGIPDSARSGFQLTKTPGVFEGLEARPPVSDVQSYLVEQEFNREIYGTDGRTPTPAKMAEAVEAHRAAIVTAEIQQKHDAIILGDDPKKKYDKMSNDERVDAASYLREQGPEGEVLADALANEEDNEVINDMRQDYFYARAKKDVAVGEYYINRNNDGATLYTRIHGTPADTDTAAVAGRPIPETNILKLEAQNTPEAQALAAVLRNPKDAEEVQAAMDRYAFSLGVTPTDVEQAKFRLELAEHPAKYLDRAFDSRNQALMDRMGLQSVQFTDGEKRLGALNTALKGVKGIGVLANFGKGLLDTAAAIKSSLQSVGILAKDTTGGYTEPKLHKGVEDFKATSAGSDARTAATDKAKAPEATDGGKAYADAKKAHDEHHDAFVKRVTENSEKNPSEEDLSARRAMLESNKFA